MCDGIRIFQAVSQSVAVCFLPGSGLHDHGHSHYIRDKYRRHMADSGQDAGELLYDRNNLPVHSDYGCQIILQIRITSQKEKPGQQQSVSCHDRGGGFVRANAPERHENI